MFQYFNSSLSQKYSIILVASVVLLACLSKSEHDCTVTKENTSYAIVWQQFTLCWYRCLAHNYCATASILSVLEITRSYTFRHSGMSWCYCYLLDEWAGGVWCNVNIPPSMWRFKSCVLWNQCQVVSRNCKTPAVNRVTCTISVTTPGFEVTQTCYDSSNESPAKMANNVCINWTGPFHFAYCLSLCSQCR